MAKGGPINQAESWLASEPPIPSTAGALSRGLLKQC